MDYTWHGKVLNEVTNKEYDVADTQFMENVIMTLLIPTGNEEQVVNELTNLTNAQVQIQLGKELYCERPYKESAQED